MRLPLQNAGGTSSREWRLGGRARQGIRGRQATAVVMPEPEERRLLATTMLEDVLDAVSAVKALAGVLVVTVDPRRDIARRAAMARGLSRKARGMAIPAPSPPRLACSRARGRPA